MLWHFCGEYFLFHLSGYSSTRHLKKVYVCSYCQKPSPAPDLYTIPDLLLTFPFSLTFWKKVADILKNNLNVSKLLEFSLSGFNLIYILTAVIVLWWMTPVEIFCMPLRSFAYKRTKNHRFLPVVPMACSHGPSTSLFYEKDDKISCACVRHHDSSSARKAQALRPQWDVDCLKD